MLAIWGVFSLLGIGAIVAAAIVFLALAPVVIEGKDWNEDDEFLISEADSNQVASLRQGDFYGQAESSTPKSAA